MIVTASCIGINAFSEGGLEVTGIPLILEIMETKAQLLYEKNKVGNELLELPTEGRDRGLSLKSTPTEFR